MKLARIAKPLRSVQVRVTLAGELNAALESYARYYEQLHGDAVDSKTLIQEILSAFLQADREFQTGHAPAAAVIIAALVRLRPTATPSHKADSQQSQVADALGTEPRTWDFLTRHSFANEACLQQGVRQWR